MKETLQVSVDEVPEGAELAADVLDDRERILIKAGTVLNADKIAALRRHNVAVVRVYADQELDAEEVESRRREITGRIEARFSRHADNDLMQQLKAAVIAYRTGVLR